MSAARERLFGFVQAGAEEGDLPTFAAALDAYRAEVRSETLREAADALDESPRLRDFTDDHMRDVNEAANELRRMAAEGEAKP